MFTFAPSNVVRRDAIDLDFVRKQAGTWLVPAALCLSTAGRWNKVVISEGPLLFGTGGAGGYNAYAVFTRNLAALMRRCDSLGFDRQVMRNAYDRNLATTVVEIIRDFPLDNRSLCLVVRHGAGYPSFYTRVVPALLRKKLPARQFGWLASLRGRCGGSAVRSGAGLGRSRRPDGHERNAGYATQGRSPVCDATGVGWNSNGGHHGMSLSSRLFSQLAKPLRWAARSHGHRIYPFLRDLHDIAAQAAFCRAVRSVGADACIHHPFTLVNPGCIRIGAGFYASRGLRLEAITDGHGQTFSPEISIGDRVQMNYDVHIGAVGRVTIGSDVLIGSHVLITDHFHGGVAPGDLLVAARLRPL